MEQQLDYEFTSEDIITIAAFDKDFAKRIYQLKRARDDTDGELLDKIEKEPLKDFEFDEKKKEEEPKETKEEIDKWWKKCIERAENLEEAMLSLKEAKKEMNAKKKKQKTVKDVKESKSAKVNFFYRRHTAQEETMKQHIMKVSDKAKSKKLFQRMLELQQKWKNEMLTDEIIGPLIDKEK